MGRFETTANTKWFVSFDCLCLEGIHRGYFFLFCTVDINFHSTRISLSAVRHTEVNPFVNRNPFFGNNFEGIIRPRMDNVSSYAPFVHPQVIPTVLITLIHFT